MDVKYIEDKKDLIVVEFTDADQTIPNMLRDELWNDKNVDYAAFEQKHPYIANPRLVVKSKDPKKSLKDAISRSLKNIDELKKAFSKI